MLALRSVSKATSNEIATANIVASQKNAFQWKLITMVLVKPLALNTHSTQPYESIYNHFTLKYLPPEGIQG